MSLNGPASVPAPNTVRVVGVPAAEVDIGVVETGDGAAVVAVGDAGDEQPKSTAVETMATSVSTKPDLFLLVTFFLLES